MMTSKSQITAEKDETINENKCKLIYRFCVTARDVTVLRLSKNLLLAQLITTEHLTSPNNRQTNVGNVTQLTAALTSNFHSPRTVSFESCRSPDVTPEFNNKTEIYCIPANCTTELLQGSSFHV